MSKKTWIKIKRGLLDPKHRAKFGEKSKIWLYLHMIDRANWEDGIVYDWRDKDEAEDMSMNWRTLQDHRQQLETEGYIRCHLKGDHQEIEITNWLNPREYSGKVYNQTDEGTEETVQGEIDEGTVKGTVKGISQDRTPTLYSQITDHLTRVQAGELFEAIFSEASNIPLPDWTDNPANINKRWRTPVWDMYKLTGKDARKTGDTIKAAVKEMRRKKLSISAPKSIEKVFIDIYSREKDKPEMPYV